MSSQEAVFDSTASAALSEEEFYITGTELLDKIQQYDEELETMEQELQYLDDSASDQDKAASTLEKITG